MGYPLFPRAGVIPPPDFLMPIRPGNKSILQKMKSWGGIFRNMDMLAHTIDLRPVTEKDREFLF